MNNQTLQEKPINNKCLINSFEYLLSVIDFIYLFFWCCFQYDVVVVHLRATGDAPILKQAKFKVFLKWVLCVFMYFVQIV